MSELTNLKETLSKITKQSQNKQKYDSQMINEFYDFQEFQIRLGIEFTKKSLNQDFQKIKQHLFSIYQENNIMIQNNINNIILNLIKQTKKFQKKQDMDSCYQLLLFCQDMNDQYNDTNRQSIQAHLYIHYGQLYQTLGKNDQAIQNYKKALDLGSKCKNQDIQSRAYFQLALTFSDMQNPQKSYQYVKQALTLNTLIFSSLSIVGSRELQEQKNVTLRQCLILLLISHYEKLQGNNQMFDLFQQQAWNIYDNNLKDDYKKQQQVQNFIKKLSKKNILDKNKAKSFQFTQSQRQDYMIIKPKSKQFNQFKNQSQSSLNKNQNTNQSSKKLESSFSFKNKNYKIESPSKIMNKFWNSMHITSAKNQNHSLQVKRQKIAASVNLSPKQIKQKHDKFLGFINNKKNQTALFPFENIDNQIFLVEPEERFLQRQKIKNKKLQKQQLQHIIQRRLLKRVFKNYRFKNFLYQLKFKQLSKIFKSLYKVQASKFFSQYKHFVSSLKELKEMCDTVQKIFHKERNANALIVIKQMKKINNKIKCCTQLKSVSSKEFNRYSHFCKRYFFSIIFNRNYEIIVKWKKDTSATKLNNLFKNYYQKYYNMMKYCKRKKKYLFFCNTLFEKYDSLRRFVIHKKQSIFIFALQSMMNNNKLSKQFVRVCYSTLKQYQNYKKYRQKVFFFKLRKIIYLNELAIKLGQMVPTIKKRLIQETFSQTYNEVFDNLVLKDRLKNAIQAVFNLRLNQKRLGFQKILSYNQQNVQKARALMFIEDFYNNKYKMHYLKVFQLRNENINRKKMALQILFPFIKKNFITSYKQFLISDLKRKVKYFRALMKITLCFQKHIKRNIKFFFRYYDLYCEKLFDYDKRYINKKLINFNKIILICSINQYEQSAQVQS